MHAQNSNASAGRGGASYAGNCERLAPLPESGQWDELDYGLNDAQRQAKLAQLSRAMRSDNPDDLRARLESTSALGLVGEGALDAAGHKLWQLEARPHAQRDLRKAMSSRNQRDL